jgi:hypothetical protein
MLRAYAVSVLLATVTLGAPAMAQTGHRNPPDIFKDESTQAAPTPPAPDTKAMLEQANQMKQLSDAIPDDIQRLSQGVISKDLSERLKKIEKLAKKLREQVRQ